MTAWIVLLLLFLLFLLYLLFAPVYFELDSRKALLRIRFHRIASVRLMVKDSLYVELIILGFHRVIDLLSPSKPGKTKTGNGLKVDVKKKKRVFPLHKIPDLLRSFRIRKCEWTIDTGDEYLNGILYPWVFLLSMKTNKQISVNFTGENVAILEIENNIARILWALIRKN